MKKYLSLEELKKDYPIGKVSVEGHEDSYSCSKTSKSFISFYNYFENNPFVTNKKEDENTLTYSIKHTIKLYDIIDYIYIESRSEWFPIDRTNNEIDVYEYLEGFYNFPSTYNEIKNNIKKLNYSIYEDTVNELHSKY